MGGHNWHLMNVSYYTEEMRVSQWFCDKRYRIKQIAAEKGGSQDSMGWNLVEQIGTEKSVLLRERVEVAV